MIPKPGANTFTPSSKCVLQVSPAIQAEWSTATHPAWEYLSPNAAGQTETHSTWPHIDTAWLQGVEKAELESAEERDSCQ